MIVSQPSKGEPSSTEVFPKLDSRATEGSWGRGLRGGGPSPGGSRVYSLRKRPAGEPFAAARRRLRGGALLRPGCPSVPRTPAQEPVEDALSRPPPPSPCAAAQAPPRLAGPGKEAPGDWPWVTCMGGERLAIGGWPRWASRPKERRRSRAGARLPSLPPERAGERPGIGFTCASGFALVITTIFWQLLNSSSILIIDFASRKLFL